MTRRRALAFAATAAAVVVIDQVTKQIVRSSLALNESVSVVDGLLWLTRVHNTGAAFGMLKGQQWLLIGTSVIVLAAIGWAIVRVKPESPLMRTALALVTGGAIGNLIDRIVAGGVTDFFDLGWFPIFNVADIALDVGVALIVLWLLFSKEHHHHEVADDRADVAEVQES
ncbi:MAG: signal peptidase II [Coriobacteriia bacterium]|nr:signal peptidase II [Coriobacteriia bacterium]